MKIKIVLMLTIGVLMMSCSHQKITFIVENNMGIHIDSLTIMPDSEKKVLSLKNGEQLVYIADMSGIPKTDGAYEIIYKNKESGEKYRHVFGYYTNGMPLEELIHIRIEKDTVVLLLNPGIKKNR